MKKWLTGFCFLTLVYRVQAQDTILVAGVAPHLYIYHGVLPGETYYSIGRNFRVSPHAIAELNKTDLQRGLKAYQLIKIPLIPANFAQQGHPLSTDVQPLYHKVQPHETLYHIGLEHNKVAADLLRSWNHIQGNSIAAGQYLIVGWLKKGGQRISPEEGIAAADRHTPPPVTDWSEPVTATAGGAPVPVAGKRTTVPSTTATAEPTSVNKTTVPPSTSAGAPAGAASTEGGGFLAEVIAAERDKRSAPGPAAVHTSPLAQDAVKMTEKKAPPAKPDENAFSKMLSRVSAENRPAPAPQRAAAAPAPPLNRKAAATDASPSLKKLPSASPPAGASKDTAAAESVPGMSVNSPFAALYRQQTLNGTNVEKGAGGWFKSNVVPGSGRYYALYDKAPRGTVIKVVNPVNGRYVFVKVLDAVPKLGENHNLVIKISDAAMQDLGTSASRFWCRLEYGK